MENNDNEVEGAMQTTPTMGSEVHVATESHLQNDSVPIEANEATPTKSNDGTTQLRAYLVNQDQAKTELANIIILHEYPLSMVDHVGFRRFIYVLCPHTAEVLANALVDCLLDWNLDLTPKIDEKFIETTRQLKVPITKKLELDCKTRWNSTYLMLNTALEYEAMLARLKQRETLYKRVPTQQDWSKVRGIYSKLEIFFDATELFSGTRYPTINLFFSTICDIKLAIGDWLLLADNLVKTMATNMKVKFEKYWDVMNCLLEIGSILDPRYKMKTIQLYYPLVYGDMSPYEIEKLKKKLCDVVEEYEKKSKQSQKVKNSQSSTLRPPLPKRGSYADKFELFMDSNTSTEHKSDLDYYLEESLLPRTSEFDILCWWKTNEIKYPILHDIAKDVFAIPVMTVAFESTFSTSGRVLNAHHSKLHSKTVETLMCARDWLWSKIQDSLISNDQKFDNDADIEEPESCSRTVTDSNSIEC
ncbi:zinc finger BED domain-containing protein DAYSLEEPER-like [Zingiber officinale]|uniref:zinc finger BED domain-containing protein DAYSLEEPER-like n=1 Tax=Zingiber officinale TaxID=94328 RepID=UPI001C4BD25D|nr:zinc finger BED domain-containing protein DAYSLEEPER-like [Zingiber officinale]